MEVLDRLLRKLKRRGHRVVLFSQVGGLRLEIEMSQATGSRAGWRPLLRPLDIAGGPNLALLVRCWCAAGALLSPAAPLPRALQFNRQLDILEDYLLMRGYK